MIRLPATILVTCLLWVSAAASGQTIAVRSLALRSGDLPDVYLKGPKDFHLLPFSSVQPGALIRAVKASPLPLYRRVMNEEGEAGYAVAQKLAVPSGARGLLLVGWMSGKEARYVAIKDDFGSARFNDWLLINTGKRPVAFRVGEKEKPVVLAPGSATTHRIGAAKGTGVAVLAQAPIRGRTRTFFSTYWPVPEGKRTVVLFVDDGEKIRVKRISDQLAPPAGPDGG
jgi:hypothetical protein